MSRPPMHAIRASARFTRAIDATSELLEKLRIEAMFVGGIARAALLDGEVSGGAVDLIALMNPPQKNQLAMMASHRGFRVEKEELEAAEELDLVPLHYVDPEGEVRIHVLLASNALYGRMVASSQHASLEGSAAPEGQRTVRIPRAEDMALLLLMGEDEEGVSRLTALPEFDLEAFRERLRSIGISPEVSGA